MKRWASVLAILFVLGAGLGLSACEPPEEMEDGLQDDGMDSGDDW